MNESIGINNPDREIFAKELTEVILKGMGIGQSKIVDRYQLISEDEYLQVKDGDTSRLSSIKYTLKEKLAKSFESASNDLKEYVQRNSIIYDDVILLQTKYNRLNESFQKGLIDFTLFDQEMNKTANSLIFIVNKLEISDLSGKLG